MNINTFVTYFNRFNIKHTTVNWSFCFFFKNFFYFFTVQYIEGFSGVSLVWDTKIRKLVLFRGWSYCHCNDCVHDVNSQLLSARRGFFHAMSLLQQLEKLLHRDAGVRRPAEGEDFPKQDSKRPAATRET